MSSILESKVIDDFSERVCFKLRNSNYIGVPLKQQEETSGGSANKTPNSNNFNEPFIPSAVVRMQLEPGLVDLLQSNEAFSKPLPTETTHDDDTMEALGYDGPLNDGPHMPRKTHIYHEGYYHALDSRHKQQQPLGIDDPIESMNPRYGHPMQKPAAPRTLRAFLFAFKKVNHDWLQKLITKLDIPFLTMETAFADCAAQSHYGEEVRISPSKPGGWHFDSGNSILHLAITLSGERYLHFQHHSETNETANHDEEQQRQQQEQKDEEKKQNKDKQDWAQDHYDRLKNTTGNVYLTSPSAFKHAVEYTQCDFPNRILALQCRTLLNSATEYQDLKWQLGMKWSAKEAIVGEFFRTQNGIRLPTLEETIEELGEMEKVSPLTTNAEQKKCGVQ